MANNPPPFRHSQRWNLSGLFVLIALACLPFADLTISAYDPMTELERLFSGLLSPSLNRVSHPLNAIFQTLAFALLGVAIGCSSGFLLAFVFRWRIVRVVCALLRSVHELFWALIFLQIFGLHPVTGLLALAIPYAATFAKIYAEIIEESDHSAYNIVRQHTGFISAFFYTRLPDLWPHFASYTRYRMECGLRSSAVLGFVGLPTLGYHLNTAFLEGQYSEVWALLILFYILIASIRYWLRPVLIPVYLVISAFLIANETSISLSNINRFFTHDIIPSPIRNNESLAEVSHWFSELFLNEALPGIFNMLLLTQITLVTTGIMALIFFPLISRWFFRQPGRSAGHVFLVIMRSTPEYILAFMLLILLGPSLLPAIIALTLHNAAIIAHLIGHYSNKLTLRNDRASGLNLYAYEVLPRIYAPFLAFIFYRWEIIMRETAILGILGIATPGFYIDNAISDIRLDKAMVLIAITALLNVAVDAFSRYIRGKLRVSVASV